MNAGILEFIQMALPGLEGKSVLEVGSRDVNGGVRSWIETGSAPPASYVGVDIEAGPGVDLVVSVHDLVRTFGTDKFDFVISTEMLEHVEDWRDAVAQMKEVVKPGGRLLVTTVRWGFPYHGYPHDYWRYEVIDLLDIFSDFIVELAAEGPDKGAYICASKPMAFRPINLTKLHMRPIGDYRKPGEWSLR